MSRSSFFSDFKQLLSSSVVYGSGNIVVRAIGFFLLPVYTRYLTTADYGVLAVTDTITAILRILFPLSLHGAAMRLYFSADNEGERRQIMGAIWLAMLLVALSLTIGLDRFGSYLFAWLFQDVPFNPYIRMAVWIAFLSVFGLIPLVLFRAEERPWLYALATSGRTLLVIIGVIYFVVFQGRGVYGYLLGTLLVAAAVAVPYIIYMGRSIKVAWRPDILTEAFRYSLPLIPHQLASWLLNLSDRAILERFVSLDELGLYSLGYQIGSIIGLIATSVNAAWTPFLYKKVETEGPAANRNLSRLTTYYVLGLSFIGLGLLLFARELIVIMTAPSFHAAHRIVPWVVAGVFLNGLYYVPINFLFLEKKTGLIPVVTVISGLVNVGLNLWLAPRYGIMGAAWATFVSYGLMLGLAWFIARRVYPFPYEYGRLFKIFVAVVVVIGLNYVWQSEAFLVSIAIKSMWLVAMPFILLALGFFTPAERKAVWPFGKG